MTPYVTMRLNVGSPASCPALNNSIGQSCLSQQSFSWVKVGGEIVGVLIFCFVFSCVCASFDDKMTQCPPSAPTVACERVIKVKM